MKVSKFNTDTKTNISLTELNELMQGNTCNGLDGLKKEENIFGTDFVSEIIYTASSFSSGSGLNIYCRTPRLGYGRNNSKQVVYGTDFRIGTITF